MFDSKNVLYIPTMLEAIEKIFIYSADFEDEEEFYFANKQLNFNASVNLLIAIGEENKKINEGLKINVEINRLIGKIYIHPKSENWYKNLVIQLVKQLGFDFKIEKSDLESDILI